MARSAMGVVRVSEAQRQVWLFRDRSNHPAAADGRCCPSLTKEGSPMAEFRDRKRANSPPRVKNGSVQTPVSKCSPPGRTL